MTLALQSGAARQAIVHHLPPRLSAGPGWGAGTGVPGVAGSSAGGHL